METLTLTWYVTQDDQVSLYIINTKQELSLKIRETFALGYFDNKLINIIIYKRQLNGSAFAGNKLRQSFPGDD